MPFVRHGFLLIQKKGMKSRRLFRVITGLKTVQKNRVISNKEQEEQERTRNDIRHVCSLK